MARVAIFLDHDITIRHFVLNGALTALARRHDLLFVFPENHRRVRSDVAQLSLPRYRTIPVSEQRSYRYRRLYHATILRKLRAMPDRAVGVKFWRDSLGREGFWKSWFNSWPLTYPLYKAWTVARLGENRALEELLAEERPDLILHPTVLEGLFVSDLVRLGRKIGVPTVFVMNSWDNPAAKAMMVGYPDVLVVWGEQTRGHARGYLGAPEKSLVCLGAAQFDLYRRPPKTAPDDYRRQLGVPAGRKLLLYAGSSKGLNEVRHLRRLEEAVDEGTLENCAVLYRPHPWRAAPKDEEHFFSAPWKHVVMEPAMEQCYRMSREQPGIHIRLADYEDTHIVLNAVDAVVSPLSTILLEAALHGKPVAAYLPDEDMLRNRFLFTTANMVHFADFFERVECLRCEKPQDLVADCRRLLERADEPGLAERLRKQCEYFVEPSDRPYGDRLNDLIRSVLAGPARSTREA